MTTFKMTAQLWLVVDLLAVYRLTILVTQDQITAGIRGWVGGVSKTGNAPRRPRAWYFVTCPWCTSIYLGAGVVALTVLYPGGWKYVAYVLACSALAGFLAERTG